MTIELIELLRWLLVPAVGGLLWLIWRLRDEQKKELEKVKQESNDALAKAKDDANQFRDRVYKRLDEAHEDVTTQNNSMAAWQLEIVRTYATKAELERVEARISAGFEKLEAKLDRVLSTRGAE